MLLRTFWQKILRNRIILPDVIRIIQWRIKTKKQMKDRHKAMHQGMILFLFFFIIVLFDCLPCQAWLITCVYVCNVVLYNVDHCREWPCYCLIATPWFSDHFLDRMLRFQAWCLIVHRVYVYYTRRKVMSFNIWQSVSQMFDVPSIQNNMTLSY